MPWDDKLQAYPLVGSRGTRDRMYGIEGHTYPHRRTLRQNGAKWDGDHRRWVGDAHAVRAVRAQRMFRARTAPHCHMPEEELWASEKEIRAGEKMLDCRKCGSGFAPVAILAYQDPWSEQWDWIRDSYQWRDWQGQWHAVEIVRGGER